jgi:hypothetical protein
VKRYISPALLAFGHLIFQSDGITDLAVGIGHHGPGERGESLRLIFPSLFEEFARLPAIDSDQSGDLQNCYECCYWAEFRAAAIKGVRLCFLVLN